MLKNTKIQLGEIGEPMLSSFLYGGISSNIKEGSLPVDIYMCPACGKLEFYNSEYIEEKKRKKMKNKRKKQTTKSFGSAVQTAIMCITQIIWSALAAENKMTRRSHSCRVRSATVNTILTT